MFKLKKIKLQAWVCCLVCACLPETTSAQPAEGTVMTMGTAMLGFGYKEFSDTGAMLDRELGPVPGMMFKLDSYHDRWLLGGEFSYYGGGVTYQGQTNTGVPIETTTNETIIDMAVRSERWEVLGNGMDYGLYLGGGYHHWIRDITSTSTSSGAAVGGLYEVYQWLHGFVGAKFTLDDSSDSQWVFDARLTRHVFPRISVDFNGQYDKVTMPLNARWGLRLAVPYRYSLDKTTGVVAEPFIERYELGRSNDSTLTNAGVPVMSGGAPATTFEPNSRTQNFGLHLGISHHF